MQSKGQTKGPLGSPKVNLRFALCRLTRRSWIAAGGSSHIQVETLPASRLTCLCRTGFLLPRNMGGGLLMDGRSGAQRAAVAGAAVS